jgi:hypothetical protein
VESSSKRVEQYLAGNVEETDLPKMPRIVHAVIGSRGGFFDETKIKF